MPTHVRPRRAIALACLIALGCDKQPTDDGPGDSGDSANLDAARALITAETIKGHIERLSTDEMAGRGPGTLGAELARDYLIEELRRCGAKAGNRGAWEQEVPTRRVVCSDQELVFTRGGDDWRPKNGDDYVLGSLKGTGDHKARSVEVVFVGHGVQAPEYEWDDYKGLDCEGKLLVMLVGDPPAEDTSLFGGEAMTYYGRWTYKYEKAREMGAVGCLVVHKTEWAGYGWDVVFNSWSRPRMDLLGDDPDQKYGFRGWVTWDVAQRLVEPSGRTLEELAAAARTRDFDPVPLGFRADMRVRNTQEELDDINVVGVIEGSDPERKDEWVIFTAHYDHLGVDEEVEERGEDGIYNGAVDNASGCGGILALAKAWGALDPAPPRSAMFLFVGSEEKGLLGSRYYAEHPIVDPAKTLANINVDGLNVLERTTDVEVVGTGQSELEDLLADIVREDGRRILPDSESEKGYYYRSDHFNFARVGIPALYVKAGTDVPGKPPGYRKAWSDTWRENDYHRPSDEFDPSWPVTGGAADIDALFRVGYRVATASEWPQWKPESEFRAVREESLRQ